MIARRLCLLGVVLALVLPGCVVERRDFEALRDQVRLQQKQINDLKARQEELALRSDALNNGFKILGDKAEESALRIDELLERESQPARQSAAPAAAPAPAPLQASVPPLAAPAPAAAEGPILITNLPKTVMPEPPPGGEIITAGPKAEKLYAGALALYSGRDYQQASTTFKEFVAVYPDHKLAGNAQYWIGECLYSQKRFAEAAEEFAKVEKAYPASHKVPAALLKKGLSLAELKKMPEAQAALQRIVEQYGQSEEAPKAKERLERWRQP
ncbi:MAG: tol-pal system protein YbgF [Candidatus Methylomirabilia bacterium]